MSTTTPELMAGLSECLAKGLAAFMPEFVDEAQAEIERRLAETTGLHLVSMEPSTGGLLAWCQHEDCHLPSEVDLGWSDGGHKASCWKHAPNVGARRS
jgi:hypothetical protein